MTSTDEVVKRPRKLSPERKWWLSQFEWGGWSMGRPGDAGKKKWAAHSQALVKAGLLEAMSDDGLTYRITDAGRAALAKANGEVSHAY